MLTHLDEYFCHQIPTTIDRVVDSDPRWVDNHWFQAMDVDGRFIIGANFAVLPNNCVIDSGQIVVHGDRQYNLRYSRAWKQDTLRSERLNLRVGPGSMEVIEPGRKARFVLEPDNEHGIGYDVVMDTALQPVEARTPISHRQNGVRDILPYHEHLGRYTGWLSVGGVRYDITPQNCWGQRDRCWGTLGMGSGFGERFRTWLPPLGVPHNGRLHWHSHIQFEDIGFWWWLDEQMGAPRLNGTVADTRGGVFDGAVTWPIDDRREQIRLVDFKDYDLDFYPGSGKFRGARTTVVDEYGKEYPLRFTMLSPNSTRWILGEGYGDPEFLGGYNGEFFHRYDTYELEDPATIARITLGSTPWSNSEHAVRCEYDGRTGIGHLELVAVPPLARWGITRGAG